MKNSRVQMAMFAMVVFGGVETAFADSIYSFTTIAVPGGSVTEAFGINNSSQIVGFFIEPPQGQQGFLYTGGNFTTIVVGGSTFPSGINDNGQIVDREGFLYTSGSITTIAVPGALFTVPIGINNSGQIVGFFDDATFRTHGFVDTGGSFTTIDIPGASSTSANGINNSGQIVGSFTEAGTTSSHGFVDTGGNFTTIDVPGAAGTSATGINDSGQIVGNFVGANGLSHGFLDTGGSFLTIDVPGSFSTDAQGINNSGQIVGFSAAGFLATPVVVPEPLTSLTLAPCLVALFAMAWCRKKRASAGNREH